MTHPESGVLDAIAELEAEEAAQPRRPWWTSYEEAAERGAVIAVSPPSPHLMEEHGMLPQSAAFADAVDTNYAGIGGMGWRESVRRMPVDTRPMQFDGNGSIGTWVPVEPESPILIDAPFTYLPPMSRAVDDTQGCAVQVHRVSPDDSDVPLEQREGIRRLQFANERVRRLREGRLRDVVITNDTRRAREYCRRNGIPAPGLAAPYMANRPDKLRGLDLMNCRLHEVFSTGAMREWDQLSAMLRAYAGYAGYPLGWFYGRIEQ